MNQPNERTRSIYMQKVNKDSKKMKLIKKYSDETGESLVLLFEEDEDIWHLYNLVVPGDRVKGTTTRKIAIERGGSSVESERKTFTIIY